FMGEVNKKTGRLDDLAISDRGWKVFTMKDPECPEGKGLGFEINGVYGRVLIDGKGLFTNDPASHADRIGTPAGHPPLKAFLGVPLIRDGKTIGMIGLANRPGGYTAVELESAEALAPAIAEALRRKRTEEALRQSAEK